MQLNQTLFDTTRTKILIHSHAPFSHDEIVFWESLRQFLIQHNYEMVKIGYENIGGLSQSKANFPFISIPDGLDHPFYFFCDRKFHFEGRKISSQDLDFLLRRENIWRDTEANPSDLKILAYRRKSIHFWEAFYSVVIDSLKPYLTVIWNGQHPQEMILEKLCKAVGCPVLYAERGFIPGSIHLDADGILGGSELAKLSTWKWPDKNSKDKWTKTANRVSDRCLQKPAAWWRQPASLGEKKLRKKLGIPVDSQVLLFAGQVDKDTQSFLFSPFENNLLAFEWFCKRIVETGRKDIFLLGKHHPKSDVSPQLYADIFTKNSLPGIWSSEFSISDCLKLSDRVAAVNSTVLYEALMTNKPALCIGDLILSNKQIAYEVKPSYSNSTEVFRDWLDAVDFACRQERWLDFLAYLLSSSIFTVDKMMQERGMLGYEDFAKYLISTVEESLRTAPRTEYQRLEIQDSDVLGLLEWKQAESQYWQQQLKNMQSSRFWQLRERWFALKRLLRIPPKQ